MTVKKTTAVRKTMNHTVAQSTVLSTVDWLLTLIVIAIPIIGLIMTLVWAFGGAGNYNRRNFARAGLILMVAGIILGLVFGVLARSLFGIFLNQIRGFL